MSDLVVMQTRAKEVVSELNNTHIYDLRIAPPGYSGKTSLHDGTRLIQINGSDNASANRHNNRGQRTVSAETAGEQKNRKHHDKTKDPRPINGQPGRQAPPQAVNAQNRSYKSKTDFPDNYIRSDKDNKKYAARPGNIDMQKPSVNTKQRNINTKKINADKPIKDNNSPVYGDYFADKSGNTDGRLKDRKAAGNIGRQTDGNRTESRVNDRERIQHNNQKTRAGTYYAKETAETVRNSARNNETRSESNQNRRTPPENKYIRAQNDQNIRDIRTSYNTRSLSEYKDQRKKINSLQTSDKDIHTASDGRISEEQSGRMSREKKRYNYNKNQQLSENSRYDTDRPNPYNPNPVYSYGSRSSENPPENYRRSSGQKSKHAHKSERPKMTSEERRMMAAAEEARKKAETQFKREADERKKANNKLRRAEIQKHRKAFVKELGAEISGMLIDSVPLFIMFLISTALIGGIAVMSFAVALRLNFSNKPDTVIYQIGEDKESGTETFRLSADKYIRDGVLYMSMDDFAERFEFTTVGTPDELKYISRVSENIMKVKVGSSAVTVNNISLRLSAPVIQSENEILVPYDFFASYVSGFSISYDSEKSKIKLLRDITDYTVSVGEGKLPVYANAGFIPSGYSETPNINENSLPADIYTATDPNPALPEPEPPVANTTQ